MAAWLLKTEPTDYSVDDLERDGGTCWDGIGNNAALKNVRAMKPGDKCLIYHTGKEKAALAIAETVGQPYKKDGIDVVDIKFERRIERPKTLANVKADKRFADWDLVKQSRLSVVPVDKTQWAFMTK